MTIIVKYSDGRKVVVDNGKRTEYNAEGKKVIRIYTKKARSGGVTIKKHQDLSRSERREVYSREFIKNIAEKEKEKKLAVAEKVLSDLQASKERIEQKKQSELKNIIIPYDSQKKDFLLSQKNITQIEDYNEKNQLRTKKISKNVLVKPFLERVNTLKETSIAKNEYYYADLLSQKAVKSNNPSLYNAGSFTLAFVSALTEPIRKPKQFFKGLVETPINLLTEPEKTFNSARSSFQNNPYYFVGDFTGRIFIPKVYGKTFNFAKDFYVKTGSEYVPPEKIFSNQVLEGKQIMPLSKGTKYSIEKFQEANNYVVTSAPAKLKGTVAGIGKKASLLIEDPGIYVTPLGEGSPAFLRISKNNPVEYSLNPFKDLRSRVGVPTATVFKTKGVSTYPKEVLLSKGFEVVKDYHETLNNKGKVFITKRSMIGQGEIPSNGFPGSTELEGVIPFKQEFFYKKPSGFISKIKGFEKYTSYEGRNVAVREASLVSEQKFFPEDNLMIKYDDVNNGLLNAKSAYTTYKSPTSKVLSVFTLTNKESSINNNYSFKNNNYSFSLLKKSSKPLYDINKQEVIKKINSEYDSKNYYDSIIYSSKSDSNRYSVLSKPFSNYQLSNSPVSSAASSSSVISSTNTNLTYSRSESRDLKEPYKTSFYTNKSHLTYLEKPPETPSDYYFMNDKKNNKNFVPIVKKGKGFITLGPTSSFKEAFKKASFLVETTPSRSFGIKKIGEGFVNKNLFGFRKSKSLKGFFVEPSKKAINTVGEKASITFKGIRSSKKKKKKIWGLI